MPENSTATRTARCDSSETPPRKWLNTSIPQPSARSGKNLPDPTGILAKMGITAPTGMPSPATETPSTGPAH